MVAFIALFIDTMIVFFAFIAGESQARPAMPHVPLAQWMRMAYEQRVEEGVRRWLGALDGV